MSVNQSRQAFAQFLKNEHGTSGGTWSSTDGHCDFEPGKGMTLTRGGYFSDNGATRTLSWSEVERRTAQLIEDGRFMTRAELDALPTYELNELAEHLVVHFGKHAPVINLNLPTADEILTQTARFKTALLSFSPTPRWCSKLWYSHGGYSRALRRPITTTQRGLRRLRSSNNSVRARTRCFRA